MTTEDQKYQEPRYSDSEYHNWFSSQWGSMNGDLIKLGNCSFTLNESSFAQLWDAYDNIKSIIQDKYISKNKEIVDRIWNGHKGPVWKK